MTKKIIYADNAATTQMSQTALDTMIRYLSTDYGNPSQPYSFARTAKNVLKEARKIIADCIGAKPDEILFTSGGSEGDNWVIRNGFEQGRNIVTSQIEHHAILNPCSAVAKHGGMVSYLPVCDNGLICPADIEESIGFKSLLSIMMANNEIGTIEPISQYGLISRDKGALFHTDAVQAMGHIEVDVKELGIDLLSASGHKFNGPKGVGFLYVKSGVSVNPLIYGGAQERGLRAGTENIASIMAMAVALRENVENLDSNRQHLYSLEDCLLERLKAANVDFIRNGTNQLPGLVSLSFKDMDGESILHRLDLMGICISTGSACDSKNTQISHVLKATSSPLEYAKGTIRISLGKYNTIEDIESIAAALIKVTSK